MSSRNNKFRAFVIALGWLAAVAWAQPPTSASAPAGAPASAQTVGQVYPRLMSNALSAARLATLDDGVVLQSARVTIREADVADQIAKAPEAVRDQLRKNAFFLMEQMAVGTLPLAEAEAMLARDGQDASKFTERERMDRLLAKRTDGLRVSDQEVSDFHARNREMVGDQPLEAVQGAIRQHILRQKQQEVVNRHVATLGERIAIQVSAAWAKQQEALARDNPVDKARDSGKPSLVDFGAKGCIRCDRLAPILEAMKVKYDGKANVLFVSVREEQVLASRYGIESIPVQIFFDKDGKETFRHTGFWPQEELEKKLAETGAK